MATSALILVGCGGFGTETSNSSASQSQTPTIGRAYYVDSAVSGVNYVCGTQRGTTDKSGMFLFEANKGCTFSLGTMVLREVDPNLLYDGENLYEVDNRIATVLQSLDIDQDLSNGIDIDQDIVSRLDVDYDEVPSTDSELKLFKSKMRDEGAKVATADSSEKHVLKTILSNGLYRVEEDKVQKLSFEEDGKLLIQEDDKVVDDASYSIDSNNTITIKEKEGVARQVEKVKTGEQYIPMSNSKLWFSKRLADKSRYTNDSSQNSTSGDSKKIYPLSDEVRDVYLDAINRARSQVQDCGKHGMMGPVDPLSWSDKLYNAAIEHSIDMGTVDFFSHDGSGKYSDITARSLGLGRGSRSAERVEFSGYAYQGVGENIAAGIEDIDDVIEAWIDSDDHCVNLMSSSFTDVGLGLYRNKNTKHKYFWTQVFGTL